MVEATKIEDKRHFAVNSVKDQNTCISLVKLMNLKIGKLRILTLSFKTTMDKLLQQVMITTTYHLHFFRTQSSI